MDREGLATSKNVGKYKDKINQAATPFIDLFNPYGKTICRNDRPANTRQ